MKVLLIFSVLVVTLTSYGQSNVEKAAGVLFQLGVNDENHKVTFYQDTPFGSFFTIQTTMQFETELNEQVYHGFITASFDTYTNVNDSIRPVSILKGYKVYGYSDTKKALVVGRYDTNSVTEPQIEEVYIYDLTSEELVIQGIFADGVYGARVIKDNLSLLLDVKTADGIGSNLTYVQFPIK